MSQTQVEQISSAVEEMALVNDTGIANDTASANENRTVEQKKKVIVPPTWFNLVCISNFDVMAHIGYLTDQYRDLPPNVTQWIAHDLSTRACSYYGSIPAPPSAALVKQIIGINGYYLKLTTQTCLVDFIWHDRTRNEFQFWGDYHRCVRAMKEIRYRICKYVEANKHLLVANAVPGEQYVFQNDITPHPAVCLEAIIEVDENNQYKRTVDSKLY